MEQMAPSQPGRPGDPRRSAIDPGERLDSSVRIALIAAAIGSFSSPPLANVGAALALVLALASAPMRARLKIAASEPLGRAALILCATMALAMTWADAPWRARFDAWWNWRTMLLVVLTAAAFGPERWKERFCMSLVAAAALGAIVSFAMWWADRGLGGDFPGVLFRNHVTQSMALTVGAVMGVVLASQRARPGRARLLLAAAVALCVGNLVFVTPGRSGQVALLVAALASALLLLRGRRRWVVLLAVPAVAAFLVLASPMLQQRFGLIAREAPSLDCTGPESSTGLRLLLWRTTTDLVLAHPWFGYGVGGFTPAYERQVRQEMRGAELAGWCASPAHDPHNQFLRVTVEAGVLGLLAFLGLIAGAARQPAAQPYRGCALALLAAWCATSLFNSHFQAFNEGHLIALVLGALLAPGAPQPASAPNTAERTVS
jgi:O-antigen ligase